MERPEEVTQSSGVREPSGRQVAGRSLHEALADRGDLSRTGPHPLPRGVCIMSLFRAPSYRTPGPSGKLIPPTPHVVAEASLAGWAPGPYFPSQTPPWEASEVESMRAAHPETHPRVPLGQACVFPLRLGAPQTSEDPWKECTLLVHSLLGGPGTQGQAPSLGETIASSLN